MKVTGDGIRLSATDLAHHLACRHLTALDLAAALGELSPPRWQDPDLDVLELRGMEHERAYLDHLRAQGRTIADLRDAPTPGDAAERTGVAMRAGADAIAQATLARDRWLGRADVLLRVPRPSALGDWSYEVVDTKLARETRAETMLQLCLYSELAGAIQGVMPRHAHVVAPGHGFEPESFLLTEYLAYYRRVKRRLEASVDTPSAPLYPEPVAHCDICRWWPQCAARRRADDHLSLVAGLSKLHANELRRWPVTTLAALAALPLPLEHRPRRGARGTYVRVREQARVQLAGRERGMPVHELLERVPERGLARLPVPSAGDVFLDFEGDPFVDGGGLEYLFGWCDTEGRYAHRWALTHADERAAFEWLVDALVERAERYPDFHAYHFAPYEPAALRRLMGRHATRESDVDRLLRAERFVDLYAVVRQSLRASVERYSIKDLEAFYGYRRDIDLRAASVRRHAVERALELGGAAAIPQSTLAAVRDYNRDDCRSALALRDWLESLRTGLAAAGEDVARFELRDGTPGERVSARQQRVAPVKSALLEGVAAEPAQRTPAQQARRLLAELLEWHARESKAPWWEYFRLRDLGDDALLEEKSALAGLEHVERIGGTPACPIDRYRYPAQDTQIRDGNELHTTNGEKLGEVARIDIAARVIDIKKTRATRDAHPASAFVHTFVPADVIADALLRLGTWTAAHGIDAPGEHRAARDLLLGRAPRLRPGARMPAAGEDTLAAARRLALDLDGGVLAIQGPPGSGKTYTGARMICTLVRAGKRVGVSAVSHKVIRNLLEATLDAAAEEGCAIACVQKTRDDAGAARGRVTELADNAAVRAALATGAATVAGGTAWLWSREDFANAVDVLFVDEAGQMSLADVAAVSQAGRSLVLLGDPQQLEQPQQGSHPEGTNVSALEHLLGGGHTIADDRGIFLAHTWRLHPAICAFTSELFYDGRLQPRPGLERQALIGDTGFAGAGLWFAPVEHDGNQSASPEEVARVAEIVAELVRDGVGWVDAKGVSRPLTTADVLIVAPYNAHVSYIARRLPGARVGTVDKFQGQEAAVVIYTMATSAPEDAPRGMEFLYSLNRLNVATSRARCACILVASPRLLEPECRTPDQMRLANAFCRYLELARAASRVG
jgi:predicted RecB family nuclease